jgi:polyphosphate kinase
MEAEKDSLPVLEKINFLSIFSSNLDEFYRVRMPAILLKQQTKNVDENTVIDSASLYPQVTAYINRQQKKFGSILTQQVIPQLKQNNIHLLYGEDIPPHIQKDISAYFFTQVLSFIQPVKLSTHTDFFPENNKLYMAVIIQTDQADEIHVLNIPSDNLPRFYSIAANDIAYIVFIDDIIKEKIKFIFPGSAIKTICTFKLTRDAELDLQDEYEGDISEKIEMQLKKRAYGFATRFLYEPGISLVNLHMLVDFLKLQNASIVEGGRYHNLRDLASFPVKKAGISYTKWQVKNSPAITGNSLFSAIAVKDIILHTPYESYGLVLRFFNEAAIDKNVTEIYTTMYRIAGDSKIANALISAAKNGKKVAVFVELKARFDEENNLNWAKRMKAAGVKIIYSIPLLKVHAKVALVKTKKGIREIPFGLFSTGNFNESTARFYTDHILFTAHPGMLRELEMLFIFLSYRRKPLSVNEISFHHLLVAQFNLQQHFLDLIEREITYAKEGRPAAITIKLNNLEERSLISKLYEASNAGVHVNLIVRSICCLVPGIENMSGRITVTRIVDRYLEHGRIFVFHNNGSDDLWLGSSDWMNRNIYRRVEVCFPVYDEAIKEEMMQMLQLQLNDNMQAVRIDSNLNNVAKPLNGEPVQSQHAIAQFISERENEIKAL